MRGSQNHGVPSLGDFIQTSLGASASAGALCVLAPHEDAAEKDNGMTKQLDAPRLERLIQIKEDILALLLEAVSLVRGTSEEQRANHWYATVCTALDKDNTQGNDSTITMQESIDALRGDAGT